MKMDLKELKLQRSRVKRELKKANKQFEKKIEKYNCGSLTAMQHYNNVNVFLSAEQSTIEKLEKELIYYEEKIESFQ